MAIPLTLPVVETQPFGYYRLATVLRVRGLRVVIYANDHPPPHVHVIGPGSEARIDLGDQEKRASIVRNRGLSRAQLAAVLTAIDRNETLLLRRWREIHGDA